MLSIQLWRSIAGLTTFGLATCILPLYGEASGSLVSPMTVIQVDPHNPSTLLAATATALLFRTHDGADSWTPLAFPAELRATLHAVLINPARPSVYLVAVSSETPLYAGVFQSVDAGVTWEPLRDLAGKQVWSLAAWAGDGRVIAAGAQDGVYLTRDGGASWKRTSRVAAAPRPVVSLKFDPADSNVLYAGTPHLAWKTSDGGANWNRIQKGMDRDSDIFSIEVDGRQSNRVFVGACSGIYRSLDGGGSWVSLEGAVGVRLRTYVVAHDPRNSRVVFAGTSAGLFQTPDGGTTWRKLSEQTARSIAFDPVDPDRIFVATDQGVLRSDDGGRRFHNANRGIGRRLKQ